MDDLNVQMAHHLTVETVERSFLSSVMLFVLVFLLYYRSKDLSVTSITLLNKV